MDVDSLSGTKLGNFQTESLLSRGGMGIVYEARRVSMNHIVTLKAFSCLQLRVDCLD